MVMAKGPWRASGEWWRQDAWNRDEWDLALESGGVYRMFQEIDSGRWFLEGTYD
jgi:protein ImuB